MTWWSEKAMQAGSKPARVWSRRRTIGELKQNSLSGDVG